MTPQLVYANQREAYDLRIKLAWQTLAEFGLNDKTGAGEGLPRQMVPGHEGARLERQGEPAAERDYGFLHGNCKRLIQRLHLLLRVYLPKLKEKPALCCKHCGGVLTLIVIPYPRNQKPPDGPQATGREMRM